MKIKYMCSFLLTTILFFVGCSGGDDKNIIEASGNIEATNITVSSKTSGEILDIRSDEGKRVNKGDTIIIIDNELLSLQLEQAVAAENIAEAQLNLLKEGARKEDIEQAGQALKQAQVNYETAQKDFERIRNLYESQSVAQKQFDDTKARLEIADAQLKSARENLQKVRNFARPEELKQSRANLERQAASVKILEKNIRDSYVLSPADGFIVETFVEEGETVTQLSSLFKVSDLTNVELSIYIPEERLGRVQLGQKAEIKTDTYPDKIYEGTVKYISPEAEFTPKNVQTKDERTKLVFEVKIEIPNPEFELKAGMPADAIIRLSGNDNGSAE